MNREMILASAMEDYNEAMEDYTFVNREEAARNAAVNAIVAGVWNAHGITCPVEAVGRDDVVEEIRSLKKEFGIYT